ncbi:MAG: hypothetical protein QNJ47_15415 [Nostocaceae cyanobacterium]|nr:hypothetical protein [Nostocaceae cyanobacterium]
MQQLPRQNNLTEGENSSGISPLRGKVHLSFQVFIATIRVPENTVQKTGFDVLLNYSRFPAGSICIIISMKVGKLKHI